MKPETALELVGKYARLQRRINLIKAEIGAALDPCTGIENQRQKFDDDGGSCNFGTETHLGAWMANENDAMRSGIGGYLIGSEGEQEECPHCWAALGLIRERRQLRRQLASVKSAMTRLGGTA